MIDKTTSSIFPLTSCRAYWNGSSPDACHARAKGEGGENPSISAAHHHCGTTRCLSLADNRPVGDSDRARTRLVVAAGGAGPDVRRALLPKIPEPAIDASLRRLAKLLVDADDQLSAENLSLADLPDRVTNPTPLSLARWKVIVSLVPAYRVKLKDAGRIDPTQHRQEMLSEPILPYPGPIWLLGTVDLQPAHLRILQAVAQAGTPITSLVIAPPNRQDDFDEFGILRTGQWLDRPIPIDDDQIIIAADPSDEALATLSILHDWREINPADIAIGILDPQIIPRLIEPGRKLGWEIDPYRIPRPDRSRPLTFLRLVADYQAQESAESLARLIRHPDLEGFLIAHAAAEDRNPIADLDQIRSRRLPKSISCTELVERDGLSWGTDFSSLLKDWPRGDRNLREWIDRFIEILIPLYQHLSEQELPADLDHVASALRERRRSQPYSSAKEQPMMRWIWFADSTPSMKIHPKRIDLSFAGSAGLIYPSTGPGISSSRA